MIFQIFDPALVKKKPKKKKTTFDSDLILDEPSTEALSVDDEATTRGESVATGEQDYEDNLDLENFGKKKKKKKKGFLEEFEVALANDNNSVDDQYENDGIDAEEGEFNLEVDFSMTKKKKKKNKKDVLDDLLEKDQVAKDEDKENGKLLTNI